MNKIIIFLCLLLAIVSVPSATANLAANLTITFNGEVEAVPDLGDSTLNITPGDSFLVTITYFNNFTLAENTTITDIDIDVEYEDALITIGGDRDDIRVEVENLTLAPQESIVFTEIINLSLVHDEFFIFSSGRGSVGPTAFQDSEVIIFKEEDDLEFSKFNVTDNSFGCNGGVALLEAQIINTGQEDQNDAFLRVTNTGLGIDQNVTFDIEEGIFNNDADQIFNHNFTLNIPQNITAGNYPLIGSLSYSNEQKADTENIVITCSQGTGSSSNSNKLVIKEVEIEVDGDDETVDDGDIARNEAKPGSDVQIKVEIENNFTNAEDLEIEDIEISVTIEDVDDGDDLDDEIDNIDLQQGRDKRETFDFDIPIRAGEGTFTVTIDVEGEDENGTSHESTFTFDLEVEKDNNELVIDRTSFNPSTIQCTRRTELSTTIVNIGEDEEDVRLRVFNDNIGFEKEDTFTLDEGSFDEDQARTKTFTIDIGEDISPGIYPFTVIASYDGSKRETRTVDLNVGTCTRPATTVVSQPVQRTTTTSVASNPNQVIISSPGAQIPTATQTVNSEELVLLALVGILITITLATLVYLLLVRVF